MSVTLSLKEFSNINLYNNSNIESVMSRIINESTNAILISMYEDKVILYDNFNKNFYYANYSFNKEKFIIENFEKINLIKDTEIFEDAIRDYFASNDSNVEMVKEAYKNIYSDEESLLLENINTKLSKKTSDNDIFKEIYEAKEKVDLSDIVHTKFFRDYGNQLVENVYYVDFKSPIRVTLLETENKIYHEANKDKALNMWNDDKFRKTLVEAVSILLEDVRSGEEKLISIFEKYSSFAILNQTEFKEVISKSLLMENVKNTNKIMKGVMALYNSFSLNETVSYLKEEIQAQQPEVPPTDTGVETQDTEAQPEKPTTSDLDAVIGKLEALNENITDEKAKEFISGLITKLNEMKENTSYDPEMLKDIANLLTPAEEGENAPKKTSGSAPETTEAPAKEKTLTDKMAVPPRKGVV